jgi:hypothetical protein
MWVEGNIGAYHYSAKVFQVGSRFGVNGGRISKLFISGSRGFIAEYDRGWSKRPRSKAAKTALNAILALYPEEALSCIS